MVICIKPESIPQRFVGAISDAYNGQEYEEQPTPIPSTIRPINIKIISFLEPPGENITIEVPIRNRAADVKIIGRCVRGRMKKLMI
jgi:hypothetical protein